MLTFYPAPESRRELADSLSVRIRRDDAAVRAGEQTPRRQRIFLQSTSPLFILLRSVALASTHTGDVAQ